MQTRQSRMDKYYDSDIDIDEGTVTTSRTKKNQELYKEVGSLDLQNFDLNNNVSVIGESTENISLDEIKDILSEKYRDTERKKSIGDTEEIALPKINLDETREYDLNSILEKVKENKEVNYEEDRLKKVRSSQYDILKDLDILNSEEEIEEEDLDTDVTFVSDNQEETPEEIEKPKDMDTVNTSERQLLELIDTIVAKELIESDDEVVEEEIVGDLDPLDILSDLRGDDDTKVMGAIQIDEETENTLGLATDEIALDEDTDELEYIEEDDSDTVVEEVSITKVDENTMSDSFITDSVKIVEEDFDDFDDLKEKGGFTKFLIGLLVVLIIIVFIAGIILLINRL